MRTDDIKKVAEKGFIVIRPSDEPRPCIKKWSRWKEDWIISIDKFKDKDDRDKSLNELLKSNNIILD